MVVPTDAAWLTFPRPPARADAKFPLPGHTKGLCVCWSETMSGVQSAEDPFVDDGGEARCRDGVALGVDLAVGDGLGDRRALARDRRDHLAVGADDDVGGRRADPGPHRHAAVANAKAGHTVVDVELVDAVGFG